MKERQESKLVLQSGEQVGSCMWMQSRVVKKGWILGCYCRVESKQELTLDAE
jgi:hypothetical protein